MKKAFMILCGICVLLVISLNVNIKKNTTTNKLTLSTIEAISYGENSEMYTCHYAGSLDCPGDNSIKVKYIFR